MTPSVSVIMNIQNGEPYLRESMDSVFAQDWEDFELIVWDSHSTDSSPDIAQSYRDPRLRYMRPAELTTLGRARQAALDEARGEWVAYLDQDDLWTPNKLRRQFDVGSTDPRIGLVYGRTISFYASGARRDLDHRHEFEPLPQGRIFELLFRDACFVNMSSTLFRRAALQRLGPVPDAIRWIPDYFMLLGVAQHNEARAVEEVVCHYRWHDSNMTWRLYKEMHEECIWLIEHFSEALEPALAERRRRVHQTNIAYKELQGVGTLAGGLRRLVRDGSVPYFMTRPFARTARSVRRRLQTPYWLRTA